MIEGGVRWEWSVVDGSESAETTYFCSRAPSIILAGFVDTLALDKFNDGLAVLVDVMFVVDIQV